MNEGMAQEVHAIASQLFLLVSEPLSNRGIPAEAIGFAESRAILPLPKQTIPPTIAAEVDVASRCAQDFESMGEQLRIAPLSAPLLAHRLLRVRVALASLLEELSAPSKISIEVAVDTILQNEGVDVTTSYPPTTERVAAILRVDDGWRVVPKDRPKRTVAQPTRAQSAEALGMNDDALKARRKRSKRT